MNSRLFQRSSVRSSSLAYKLLLIFLAGLEAKVAQAQASITRVRERVRDIADKVDAVAFESAQLALNYAVSNTLRSRDIVLTGNRTP